MNPKCARLFFAFTGASRFPWRFAFPGDSSVMSWQLAIRVSWRFPCPGDSQHVLAGRGLVVLQLQLKVGSWLLLVPPRRLVIEEVDTNKEKLLAGALLPFCSLE